MHKKEGAVSDYHTTMQNTGSFCKSNTMGMNPAKVQIHRIMEFYCGNVT